MVFFLHTGNKNASLSWNNDLSKTALCMLFYYHSYCTHENGSNLVRTEIERGMDLLTGQVKDNHRQERSTAGFAVSLY